ncbi:MAG: glycosyltransferase family 9 protein [Candidatus Kapaibacterium sp.]
MKVLINALSGIGDALMFSPALKILHDKLPNCKFDMLVMFDSVKELFRTSPYLSNIYHIDFLNQSTIKSLKEIYKIRKNDYFISINVYPSNRYEYNILNFMIGAQKRLGHKYLHNSAANLSFLNNINVNEEVDVHNVVQNLNLIKMICEFSDEEAGGLDIFLNEDDDNLAKMWLKKEGIVFEKPIIGFHAGSSTLKNHINKRWDVQKYAELGNRLIEEKNASILLFGNEYELNNHLNKLMHNRGVIASTSNYMDSMARLKQCNLFVSNDTAFLHSASAFEIPVVAIFGYTNYKELYPWKTKHIIVRKELDCSPCFYNSPKPAHCKWRGDEEFKCIRNIELEEVFFACTKLLN